MELVSPGIGLVFWMTVSFLIVLFILTRYAWKPVMKMLKEREENIDKAINAAQKAQEEMKKLEASNQKLLQEAKEERDRILKEARKTGDILVEEARTKAGAEANRIVNAARESIQNEKMAALTELKNQIATLSIDIAEKILKEELSNPEKQKSAVDRLLKDINLS